MANPIFGSNSLLDAQTLTTTNADSSFPKENLFNDRLWSAFKGSSNSDPFDIITDAGAGNSTNVDYFMCVGHDLGTQTASINFASSPDNSAYTDIIATTAITADTIISRSFTTVKERFYRLRVTLSDAIFSIGELQWGEAVAVPHGTQVPFDPQEERINARFTRSQTGNILGATQTWFERSARFNIPLVSNAFVRGSSNTDFGSFWDDHARLLKPFLVHWNPGNPGTLEKDSFFGIVDPRGGIRRPLRTQLDVGKRDLIFRAVGLGEQ